MGSVTVPQIGVDDPLWHWIETRSASDVQTHDNLWLRPVDLAAALPLRSYAADCDVVVEWPTRTRPGRRAAGGS